MENGVPDACTFRNVIKAIDTEQLHRVFVEWMKNAIETVTGVVAVDGKQARRTKGGKKKPLHVVSAFFKLDEIPPRLSALFIALEHTDFLCRIKGKNGVIHKPGYCAPALLLNPVNFDRVEILTLHKSIFAHPAESVPVFGADF